MTDISRSPDRGTFQLENYLARKAELSEEPSDAYIELFKTMSEQKLEQEQDPEWQKDNLEYDLRASAMIKEKCQEKSYAQNLYAALCNMQWQRIDVFPILTNQYWSCSWRYAGGIIADIREEGDYIDWYCSGIRGTEILDFEFNNLTQEQQMEYKTQMAYVSEGVVTIEIKEDLKTLGWQPEEWSDTE